MQYANIYLVTREYGGPEEGGWWYDAGVIKDIIPIFVVDNLDEVMRAAQAMCDQRNKDENRLPASSAASTGYYEVYLEDAEGVNFPKETPYYE